MRAPVPVETAGHDGDDMKRLNLTITVLKREDDRDTDGAAGGARRELGFRPAYFDCATCCVHLSRYRDGRIAPFHLLEGLPEHLVAARGEDGRVAATKPGLMAGFERNGFFYTRAAAARAIADWDRALRAV